MAKEQDSFIRIGLRSRYEAKEKIQLRKEKIEAIRGALMKHYGRSYISTSEVITYIIDNFQH